MPEHTVGTQEQWLSARKELLAAEKEHMRHGDELARRRRELPWVAVEKEYSFETDEGSAALAERTLAPAACCGADTSAVRAAATSLDFTEPIA